VPFKEMLPVHWWIGDKTGKVVIADMQAEKGEAIAREQHLNVSIASTFK
jgi:hypothetical protein